MIQVVVSGAAGRMGQLVMRLVAEDSGLALHGAVETPDNPAIGSLLNGVRVVSDVASALRGASVLIDFSAPAGTLRAAQACAQADVAAVIGTTGVDATQRASIEQAARRIPIVFAPNMSVGVNVMFRLVEQAKTLLGDGFSSALFEAHHRWKKDSPSGTAKKLAEVAGIANESVVAVRGGDVIGEHTVFFLGDGERLEITHRASSREAFARGALRAAHWVVGQPPGLYDMRHVLAGY